MTVTVFLSLPGEQNRKVTYQLRQQGKKMGLDSSHTVRNSNWYYQAGFEVEIFTE